MKLSHHAALAVADHILETARIERYSIVPLALLKLVYLAHGWSMALLDQALFREGVEAWIYGPIVPVVYRNCRQWRGDEIDHPLSCQIADKPNFSDDELKLMKQVVQGYGWWPAVNLSAHTHKPGSPWEITRSKYGENAVIPNELIQADFKRIAQEIRAEDAGKALPPY